MRKIAFTLIIAVLGTITAFGQFWTEDFSGLNWDEYHDHTGELDGWTIQEGFLDQTSGNGEHIYFWMPGDYPLFSGGSGVEAQFNGHLGTDYGMDMEQTARFTSPIINTSGKTELSIAFTHALNRYSGQYYEGIVTIGLATTSDGGTTWNTIWNKTVGEYDEFAIRNETFLISNSDVGSANFQVCFYMDGDPFPIKHWAFDDVELYQLPDIDVIVQEIENKEQHIKNETFTPSVKITNGGINASVTFDAEYKITQYGTETIVYNEITSVTLNKGDVSTITFPSYAFTEAGKVYKSEVLVTVSGDANITDNYLSKNMNTWSLDKQQILVESSTYLT